MALSFRKTKKISDHTNLNVNKKSVGVSTGVKGARVSLNSRGKSRVSLSIPGTGIRYTKAIDGGTGALMMLFAAIINMMIFIVKASVLLVIWIFKLIIWAIRSLFYLVSNAVSKNVSADDCES